MVLCSRACRVEYRWERDTVGFGSKCILIVASAVRARANRLNSEVNIVNF